MKRGIKMNDTTKNEITETIFKFYDSYDVNDPKGFRSVFHTNARIFEVWHDSDWLHNEWGDYGDIPTPLLISKRMHLIDATNDIAVSKSGMTMTGSHDFTEYWTLLKVDGSWKITSCACEPKTINPNALPMDGIMETLQNFYNGFDTRNYDFLKKALHRNALIYSNDRPELRDGLTLDAWFSINPALTAVKFERETLLTDYNNNLIAFVKDEWRSEASLVVTNYYHLVFFGDSWKITVITFNAGNY
jgi:hypothetical protein